MSKKKAKFADTQLSLEDFFNKQVDKIVADRSSTEKSIVKKSFIRRHQENDFELMSEIAVSIKQALRSSGLSREQLVDGINNHFGRTVEGAKKEPPTCRNPLTINMLNNYLSKPVEYPIPAFYLFAIHRVTKSLKPARVLVAAEGARVATGEEIRQMTLGKIEENLKNLSALKKQLTKSAR